MFEFGTPFELLVDRIIFTPNPELEFNPTSETIPDSAPFPLL
jgi:hypothetical protein